MNPEIRSHIQHSEAYFELRGTVGRTHSQVPQLHGQDLSLLTVQIVQEKLVPSDVLQLQPQIVQLDMAEEELRGHGNYFITLSNCKRSFLGSHHPSKESKGENGSVI